MVRLFLGGLPPDVTPEQLVQRFAAFGAVTDAHVAAPKTYAALPSDAGFYRGFGFVELQPQDDAALRRALAAYSGSKWRGHVLRCQLARPDGLQRLREEQEGAGPVGLPGVGALARNPSAKWKSAAAAAAEAPPCSCSCSVPLVAQAPR